VTRLLRGELIKVRTTRTALGFGLAAVLLTLANVLLTILAGDPVSVQDKRSAMSFGGVLSIILLIYGIVGATGEFRHRTLAPAVLIAPDRVRLFVARMGAYGLSAGLFGVLMGAGAFAIGVPLLAGTAGPDLGGSDYLSVAVGGLSAAILCAVLGVAFGTLVRNQVQAVVGLFVWILVLEPLVGFASENYTKFTIGISTGSLAVGGNHDSKMLTAAVVLTAWTAALAVVGALVDRRRDVE
jgi:ABC-2 type transport system permease protein